MTRIDDRREYAAAGLEESQAQDDPILQFAAWFAEAQTRGVPEPHAMVLASVGEDGMPAARVVLLRGFDVHGFVFFTNYGSAKGRQLDATGSAAAVFFWPELERQVRLRGQVSRVSAEESDAYFHSRPRGSQLGAWASPQSQVVASRAELDRRLHEVEARFADGDIPCPPFWGGYRIEPREIEFWQGRPSRLHDRLLYTRAGSARWRRDRLAP